MAKIKPPKKFGGFLLIYKSVKHLIKYKLFENIEDDKSEIRDYLSNLEDTGFYFDFYPDESLSPDFHKIKGYFQVEISKYSKTDPDLRDPFFYEEIKSEVDRLIEFVNDKYRHTISNVYLSDEEIIAVQIDFFKK